MIDTIPMNKLTALRTKAVFERCYPAPSMLRSFLAMRAIMPIYQDEYRNYQVERRPLSDVLSGVSAVIRCFGVQRLGGAMG
jgi:hypothetical protein